MVGFSLTRVGGWQQAEAAHAHNRDSSRHQHESLVRGEQAFIWFATIVMVLMVAAAIAVETLRQLDRSTNAPGDRRPTSVPKTVIIPGHEENRRSPLAAKFSGIPLTGCWSPRPGTRHSRNGD